MKRRKQFMALSLAAVLTLGGAFDSSSLSRVHAEEPTGQAEDQISTVSEGDTVSGNQGAETVTVTGSFDDFSKWLPKEGDTVVPAGVYGDEVVKVEMFGRGADYGTGSKLGKYTESVKMKDNGSVTVADGVVQAAGALKITSTKDISLVVAMEKADVPHIMYLENGVLDGEQFKEAVSGTIELTFEVKAGKEYYLWSEGAKIKLWGLSYSYQQEVEKPAETTNPAETTKPAEPTAAPIPAFPGAEGGGMYATGGRGGDVYVVTNLNDSGEGSLRYGIDTAPATGRTIVFDVGGTINLTSKRLSFSGKKNITIAGQTAPGDGITIAGYDTDISNSENLIIRFVRFRVGTENLLSGGDSMDALWGRDNSTFIIDHCTFSWNTDETLSTYRGKDGTVQWCIISESLTVSGHSKGRHGYGGIWGGDNTVFQYNLLTNHTSRNPRIGGGSMGDPTKDGSMATVQLSNNVLYNHGYYPCYGGGYTYTNYINNYVKPGPGTRDTMDGRLIFAGEKGKPGGFYVNGNILYGNDAVTEDNSLGIKIDGNETGDTATVIVNEPYVPTAGAANPNAFKVSMVSAEECYDLVLNNAGATYPFRDAVDARVVAQVRDNTGFYINTPDEVGGYPARTVTAESIGRADADHDGIPDAWEEAHGLNSADSADSTSLVTDENDPNCGYTWLEVYCNDLVKDVVVKGYEAPNPNVTINLENNTLVNEGEAVTVTATATANSGGSIEKVEFYNGDQLAGAVNSAPYTYTYTGLKDGTYNISVRAYDNDGNATQSTTSKLYVNSTAGTGEEWTSKDIGNPGIRGTASLTDGVLTVKGAGKLGRWEGSVLGSSDPGAFDTTDDFQYVYQQLKGDGELVAKLDSYIAVDQHTFNGLMFRESLDNDAATAALGLTMTKIWDECNSVWTAFMVKRDTKGGNITTISSSIDSSSNAKNNGIPAVSGLNFKSGNDFNGTWLKLTRFGNTFIGAISENGVSWQTVGEFTVEMPETVYIGFAVEAGKVTNKLENYGTAKFSNIEMNTDLGSITYELENVKTEGAKVFTKGKDLVITLTNAEGYLLPETVEVTAGGKAAEVEYDREKGTILIKAPTEDIVIKAQGMVRPIPKMAWEEVDPADLLTVEEKDGKIILTQIAESGDLSSGIPGGTDGQKEYKESVNESWILFPEVNQNHTMTLKLTVTKTLPADGTNDRTGVYVGLFDINEGRQAFETVCFRPTAKEGVSPYWTKLDKTGNGSPKKELAMDTVYTIELTYDSKGQHFVDWSDGTNTGKGTFKASNSYLISAGTPVRYGIGLIGATAEITELTLIDNESNVVYEQADYTAVNEALDKVEKLNADDYVSFDAVLDACGAVKHGIPKAEQEKVDAMAKVIEDAIAALEKKPVPSETPVPMASAEPKTFDESVMTEELKDAIKKATGGAETAAALVDHMKQDIINQAKTSGQEMVAENIVVQEVQVTVSNDGGKTWKPVTAETFPKEGLTLTLPYPNGTNRNDFEFVVTHLITMDCNGLKAGELKKEPFELTDEGLKLTIYSASPFAVGWSAKTTDNDDDDDDDEDDGPEETADNKSDDKTSTPAKTGDHMGSFMWMWTVLLFAAAAGIASTLVVKYRRKK